MKKMMYLIRGSREEKYTDFKKRIFLLTGLLAKDIDIKKVKVVLTEDVPPGVSVIPFKKKKIASISIVYEGDRIQSELLNTEGYRGTFEVTEALPVAYEKTWPDGQATPGVCLLTLFNKKKSIDYKTFIDRWHNSHTPLSLKIHPLWNYNRNVVEDCGVENKEKWDGIVEEHCKTRSELLNPFKFFGHPLYMIPRMLSVYLDTKSFLDYGSIEPYLAMEYHIKS